MTESDQFKQTATDQPLLDTTAYGSGPDDSVTDLSEQAAVTQHMATIGGKQIPYTARAGHLVTADLYTAQPAAKLFYVSFTANDANASTRPVTFFYNGGPGSSSIYLLLGSFAPRRIETSMPLFTPPPPYKLIDNPDSLLDVSDLVFIDPVGTGYSAAVAPNKNSDFWGVDQDARSIKQFVKRYLTVFRRWNSPKFLFGESYGTPRTCVLTWMLHEDGVDLNGVVLQSSVLDYSQNGAVGLLPTLAADALYHGKATVSPPSDLPAYMAEVEKFANGPYADALNTFPHTDPTHLQEVLQRLSEILGISPDVLKYWKLDPSAGSGAVFLNGLFPDRALGSYDGRVTADDSGIAGSIDPNSGNNDPMITAVGGVYVAMWNVYLNEELQYTPTSPFIESNDQAFKLWDFRHTDPTGAQKGGDQSVLYTAGDLAAAMALNQYLKVFSANGYYDAVTPYFQTILNFKHMPLKNKHARDNLRVRNYESGHMVYLDDKSRAAMKVDLAKFYEEAAGVHEEAGGLHRAAAAAQRAAKGPRHISYSPYTRRVGRTPY